MIYTFILMDKPGAGELRQRVAQHKAYLVAVADRMAFAGPLTHDDGQTHVIGSLLAIDFPSRDAAHVPGAGGPFTQAGLYASTAVHAFVNLWPRARLRPPPEAGHRTHGPAHRHVERSGRRRRGTG